MITGFIDESGTLSPGDASDVYTIALLLTHDPRRVEALVRRLRQSLHRRHRTSELKAAQSDSTIIRRLLTRLGETESEIYILVVDKAGMISGQSEPIYHRAIAKVVRHCLEYHPEVQLFLDKRYTSGLNGYSLNRPSARPSPMCPDKWCSWNKPNRGRYLDCRQ